MAVNPSGAFIADAARVGLHLINPKCRQDLTLCDIDFRHAGALCCSCSHLILQTVSCWRRPCSGDDHFFLTIYDCVKESFRRCLAETLAALMRTFLIVTPDPFVEIVLQLFYRAVGLLAKGYAVEFTTVAAGVQAAIVRSWRIPEIPPAATDGRLRHQREPRQAVQRRCL